MRYVCDEETGLYYVATRYYNSLLSRFANEDMVIINAGGQSLGSNMYTYCLNQPVTLVDSSGCMPQFLKDAINWFDENIMQPVAAFVDNVVEDINQYDRSNQSEEVVFDANYFASYKGTFVLKTSANMSFSFGVIVLSSRHQYPDILKHEYGHKVQLDNKGWISYISEVAIPSFTINALERTGKLPYDYYSYPWEAEANELGGATLSQRNKPSLPEDGYSSYWDLIPLFFE